MATQKKKAAKKVAKKSAKKPAKKPAKKAAKMGAKKAAKPAKKSAMKSAKKPATTNGESKLRYVMIKDLKGTRDGTEEDLGAIHNDDWRDAVDDLRAYDGDLHVDGDFDASNGGLIVHGNLSVTGTVALDETGSLIVTGNLSCRNLGCEGNLEIQGETTVAGTVFGFYEAGISFFEGPLKAALLLEGNHAFEYEDDKLVVGTHLRFANFRGLSTGTPEQARAVLSDEAYAELGRLIGISEIEGKSGGSYGPLLRTKGFLRA